MTSKRLASAPSLARKLRSGERTVGLIAKMVAPAPIELAGHLGFDFVIVDTEHGLGGAELDNHIRAADSAGLDVLVRVSTSSRTEIARALDGGAAGVAVPQVDTPEQARAAVSLAHYPPVGVRGFATSTRAGRQGTASGASHLETARQETVVVVQIESALGVRNAVEIMSVAGVSAVWVGLSDLMLELGRFGQPEHPDVRAAVGAILDAAALTSTPLLMIADSLDDGRRWTAEGIGSLLVNFTTIVARSLGQLLEEHRTTQSERTEP